MGLECMKVSGEFNFLAAGRYFIALDMPQRESVIKFLRPDGPLTVRQKGWQEWLLEHFRRAKRIKKAAMAGRVFRMLYQSETIDIFPCFPETEIVDEVDVSFVWEGQTNRYQGPAYIQRRVEVFGNDTPLDSFNWDAIIEVQHYLWRSGVGLGSGAETWGPKNWCRTKQDKVRLADLSSLTQDKKRVGKRLNSAIRQKRRQQLERFQPVRCREHIDPYLAYIGEYLNRESLNQLWRAGF